MLFQVRQQHKLLFWASLCGLATADNIDNGASLLRGSDRESSFYQGLELPLLDLELGHEEFQEEPFLHRALSQESISYSDETNPYNDPSDSDDYEDFGEIDSDDEEFADIEDWGDFDVQAYFDKHFKEQYLFTHNLTNQTEAPLVGLDPAIMADIESRGSLAELKELILEFVTHAEEANQEPPELEEVLVTLSTQFGHEPYVLEYYIDLYPDVAHDILESYEAAVMESRERKIKVFVDIFLNKMIEELSDGIPMEKVLEHLNMESHYMDEALEAYNHPDVVEALQAAEIAGGEKINELTESYTPSTAPAQVRRKLVSAPQRRTKQQEEIEAGQAEIQEHFRQRKLRRVDILKTTKAFVVRVNEHKDFVHHHSRRLSGCEDGMTHEECNVDRLADMAETLVDLTDTVDSAISPVIRLFNLIDEAEDKLSLLKSIMLGLSIALLVGQQIDGILFGGAPVFTTLKNFVDNIKPRTDDAAKYAEDFEDKFIRQWNSTLNGISDMMNTFTTITETTAGVGGLFADVVQNQCVKGIVNDLLPGVIGTTEDAIDAFVGGAQTIVNAVGNLVSKINNPIWRGIRSGLTFIADLVNKIWVALNPFEPLAGIITAPIPFPWVSIKTKDYLGEAKCVTPVDRSFKQVGATCWEKDSTNWKLSGPLMMQAKCSKESMSSSGVANTCKVPGENQKKHSGTKSVRKCGKVKIKKKVKGVRIKVSVKKCFDEKIPYFYFSCPSGTTWFLGKCYKTKCPGSFIKGLPNICIPKPIRAQEVKGASCSKYNTPSWMDPVGLCWKKCERGFDDIGVLCIKTGTFDFSIQDIFDQFDKIVSKIEGTKFYKMVQKGMEEGIAFVLKIFEAMISQFIGGFDLDFTIPSLSIGSNLLPFNQLNVDLPSGPSADLDLTGGILNKVNNIVPLNVLDKLPSLNEITEKLQSLFNVAEIQDVADAVMDIVPSIQCKSWDKTTLELGDAFKALTGKSCDQCNKQVPICAEMGLDFLNNDIQDIIKQKVKPVINRGMQTIKQEFRRLKRARELQGHPIDERELQQTYDTVNKWQVVLPIPIQTSFGVDESMVNQKDGKWDNKGGSWESYLMADHGHEGGSRGGEYLNGFFIALIPTLRLELGFNYVNWIKLISEGNPFDDFGFKFGMDFELKFSSTGDVNSLVARRRQWVEKMRGLETSDIYNKGDSLCFQRILANRKVMQNDPTGGKWGYRVDTSVTEMVIRKTKHPWSEVCKPLEEAVEIVWEKNEKDACEPDDLLEYFNPKVTAERRRGIRCVKYWWDTKRLVESRIAEFERLKEEAMQFSVVNMPVPLWLATKEAVKFFLKPWNWPIDSSIFVNMLVDLTPGLRQGLRPRMWVRDMTSPVDYFEHGLMIQLDFNNGVPKFFGLGIGSITLDALNKYREEKRLMKEQPKIEDKEGNMVDRVVGEIPVVAVGASIWCQVSFFPNKGQVQDVFFCPGIVTV